jgi:Phage head completion protein (GPL)
MTGLTAPPDNFEPAGVEVAADGWFPAISTEQVRAAIRMGEGAVTDARLIQAIEGGILSGLRALHDWRIARALEGAADLAAVTEDEINGKNRAELIWHRVVTFYAAAELADMHVDVSATDEAIDRNEDKRDTAGIYRVKAYDAVADLRAIGAVDVAAVALAARNRVELI